MKKRNVTLLAIAIFLVGMTSLCHAYVAYYNLFVVSGNDYPGRIYQLKVLPNGQILDTYTQYTIEGNWFDYGALDVSSNYQFLLIASDDIHRFQIQLDGSLFSLGTTPSAGSQIAITPNGQIVIVTLNVGSSTIYSLDSSGDLINGTPGPEIAIPKADPLGRGVLAGITSAFSAYTINYNTRTLTQTTSFLRGDGIPYGFNFTPDGKLGFMYGFNLAPNNTGDLLVMKIDSNFTITTTQVLNIPGRPIDDLAVSKDGRYLWASAGYIELFSIDTNGLVTDTGNKYYVLNQTGSYAQYQRNTPNGNLAIVEYLDFNLGGSFATAYINGDGSLTWTGYTFAFDSAHPTEGTVVDYAIVPVYATGIPEELWKDPSPDTITTDSQILIKNP